MSLAPDRDKYRNASDAPAMLGISPYTTRQELLDRIKYGVQKNITPAVQDIFDAGHRIEALARPIAETLLGHPLQPKRFTNGNLGATLDGYYLMPPRWTRSIGSARRLTTRFALLLKLLAMRAALPALFRCPNTFARKSSSS
jgi:hypothetical protein